MKHSALFLILTLLAVPVLAAGAAKTEAEAPAYDMEAMQEAWSQARQVGDHHHFLASMEGEWTYSTTMWMDPSQPPIQAAGTSAKKMILGGRYLQEKFQGEFMGEPFHGLGTTGYDNVGGEFVGTWVDNMGTGILNSRGSRKGNALTLAGDLIDPMSGQKTTMRMVTTRVDENHHVFVSFISAPGIPEFKQMEIKYTRKGH